MPQLLEIKNKSEMPLVFRVQIEFGDGVKSPKPESVAEINALLESLKPGLKVN